jgi:hypothetical protein
MIDLFGLKKQQEPQDDPSSAPQTEGSEPAPPAPRGSHKLWAFLLVLDSVIVVAFAGVVAAKVYQHWKTPVAPLAPAPRKRPAKAADAPVASTAPVPAPEPAPVAAKPAPDDRAIGRGSVASTSRQDATAPRPPKPSMLADAPKHRETPKPADAGGKSPAAKPAPAAPAVAADGKVKALKTEFKLLAPKAKAVELVGAFIVRGGRKDMSRQDDGAWTVTLYLNPGTYRYFFSVDKKKQLDPENPRSEKGASLLTIP